MGLGLDNYCSILSKKEKQSIVHECFQNEGQETRQEAERFEIFVMFVLVKSHKQSTKNVTQNRVFSAL